MHSIDRHVFRALDPQGAQITAASAVVAEAQLAGLSDAVLLHVMGHLPAPDVVRLTQASSVRLCFAVGVPLVT